MENNDETVETTTDEQTNEETVENTESEENEVDFKAEAAKWKAIAERAKNKPQKPDSSSSSDLNKLEERLFFIENKEYAPYKDLINGLKGDKTFEEVIESNQFKSIHEKLQKYDELESNKSVIHNNSRIATPGSDQLKDLEKAQNTGNWVDYLDKYKGVKM